MPNNPPNKPTLDFPFQSVVVDTLLTERSSSFVGTWAPFEPGTPFSPLNHSAEEFSKYQGNIFLGQNAGKDNEFQERYWATQPHTQDVYNYDQEGSADSPAHPIFTRRYLELRDSYTERTPLTAFTGLYAVKITAAGSGYDPAAPPAVTCNNGATAIAIVDPTTGAIVKITLKAEGASCTTSVTIAAPPAGGVQATAVGVLQPAACVLVKESAKQAPAPWGSLYLLVARVYETLPGPSLWHPGFNSSLGAETAEFKQRIALPGTLTALGTTIVAPSGTSVVVIDGSIQPENLYVGVKTTVAMQVPPGRTEHDSIGYEFPAQFDFLSSWVVPATPIPVEGPYAGVNYTLTAHRVLSTPAETVITYSNGATGLIGVTIYYVITPGKADRFFGIGPNTIHNAILIIASGGWGSATVEDLPASTPSSYTPGQTLVIRASERLIAGTIYEKRVTSCSE